MRRFGWVLTLAILAGAARAEDLSILSSTDRDAFAPVIAAFQAREPGITVSYTEMDTLPLYDAIIEDRLSVQPDIVISSAVDRQFRLANDGYALPHRSPVTAKLPDWARFADAAFGFTYEPLIFVASRRAFAGKPLPKSRADLLALIARDGAALAPVATYDPVTSGVGNLLGKIDYATNSQWSPFIARLAQHGLKTYCCSGDMLTAIDRGEVSLAFNVLGSYAELRRAQGADIEIVYPADYTLVISRVALALKTTPRPRAAKAFLDFLLSPEAQTLLARQTHLSAILPIAAPGLSPATVKDQATGPLRPIALDAQLLAYSDRMHDEQFLTLWRSLVPSK